MRLRIINILNKILKKKITYKYNNFCDCYFYNFDFEEGKLCLK